MRVFITAPIINNGIERLKTQGLEVIVNDGPGELTKAQLYKEASRADAMITMLSDDIDRDFLLENRHLKVIANYAVGYNNIDIKTATELGIKIGNTPDVLTEATADLALSLIMNVSRQVNHSMKTIKNGEWRGWEPLGFIGPCLRGKTLGIFGAGRIGQCLAKTCKAAFNMNVIYTSRTDKPEFFGTRVSIDELLKNSDVLSVHCDLNPETKELFNREAFKKMKSSSIFINTARGGVHNEQDLEAALRDSEIWGAGLDVTNPEPMKSDSGLLKLSNAIVTPHIGSATFKARSEMSLMAAKNIINGLKGEKLLAGLN